MRKKELIIFSKKMTQIKLKEDGLRRSIKSLLKVINTHKIYSYLYIFHIAIKLHGKDWKKVEDFIGTRSGA